MREAIELRANGRDEGGVAVPEIHDADAADKVEELSAVGIPDPGALGTVGDDFMGKRHAARDFRAS
ncbi:MAG: hypothetical protein NVSMB64_15120 [Candidatus Velthaea sp.]